jgi:hypothetical protein
MKKVFFACVLIALFVVALNMGIALAADPDLRVTELLVNDSGATGIKIFITDVTRNIGTAEASESITGYYLKPAPPGVCAGQDTVYSGKILLAKRIVPELSAGEANMGTNYVGIPKKSVLIGKGWPVPGCYYIMGVADAFKYITEINEGNNTRKSLFSIDELY